MAVTISPTLRQAAGYGFCLSHSGFAAHSDAHSDAHLDAHAGLIQERGQLAAEIVCGVAALVSAAPASSPGPAVPSLQSAVITALQAI